MSDDGDDITKNTATHVTSGARSAADRAAGAQYACLIQYNGQALGRRYMLDAPDLVIGRSTTASIVIADDSVSREHARCYAPTHTPAIEIEDLCSSNGTHINDQRVAARTALRDGDIVRLGSIYLKYFARNSIENVFHDKIYRKATIDVGTQVFNKQYVLEALDAAFTNSRAQGLPLSVIYLDLDFFKKVNDTHGHSCGDYILRESAQLAKSCLRAIDVMGRYGGEEFVVVLPNCDVRLAAALAERIRKTLEAHKFVYAGNALTQTASLGVTEIQPAFADYQTLLDDADRKLYQSKHAGRNCVTV